VNDTEVVESPAINDEDVVEVESENVQTDGNDDDESWFE
jgi:hypothetical protein